MRIARYKSAARQDIDDISEYIAADNLDAAIRLCVAVEEAVEKLTDLPGMGRLREFSNPELAWMRSWVIKGFRSYLIFYSRPRRN